MSTQDKWTNEYNDKEFAEKLEKFAIKFEQSKYKNVNEHNIKDSQTREITHQIKYCKYVIQRLDNHKKELKPLLAEAYEKYRPVLIETLEFWEGKKWFENVKNELEIDDKNIQDLKIHERLRKLAFKCDNEKENFKSYNTTALKINELEQQIELYEFVWFPLEKKKDKENPFLVDEFSKYEPVIIEALDYWKSELQKLRSGKETQNDTKHQPKLSMNQIALKYFYEGLQITRENGNEIAEQYGHTSGEKLFQRFTFYSSTANRKAKPDLCTPIKLKNKIKLIETVIELLPIEKQARAKDEVSILNGIYEAEYQ